MLANLIQGIINLLAAMGYIAISLLPRSPFRDIALGVQDSQFLRFINFVLPISQALFIFGVWLGAMAQFYTVKQIMRKINFIR